MRFASGSVLALCLLASPLAAQVEVYPTFGARAPSGDTLRLTGLEGQRVDLLVLRPADSDSTVTLVATPFSAATEGTAVRILSSAGDELSAPQSTIDFGASVTTTITIELGRLGAPHVYRGKLIFDAGESSERSVDVELRHESTRRDATLVVGGGGVIEAPVTVWPFSGLVGRPGQASLDVTLYEQASAWPIQGLTARVEEIESGQDLGFDPRSAIVFFSGTDTLDLWSSSRTPNDPARALASDETRTIRGVVSLSKPGEYRAKIRFAGTNSTDHEDQILTVVFHARHPILAILVVLVLGVFTSFFLSRFVSVSREQLKHRRTLTSIPVGWLQDEPPSMAVVHVKSMIRRAEALSAKPRLAWQDLVSDSLEEEKLRLVRMRRVSLIRDSIGRWPHDGMVTRRADKELRRIVDRLGRSVDTELLADIDASLSALEEWDDSSGLLGRYRSSLEPDVSALLRRVVPNEGATALGRQEMERLSGKLDMPAGATLDDLIEVEKNYARLKILWEWRDSDEVLDALAAISNSKSVDALFGAADTEAWKRLGDLDIRTIRTAQPGRIEAFEPVEFQVFPKDTERGENYLFKHGLEFEWRFVVEPGKGRFWRADQEDVVLRPTTNSPNVVQYAPFKGTMSAAVTVRYNGETVHVEERRLLSIVPSSGQRFLKSSSRIAWITSTVALIAAVVSGVLMFYVDNAVFGTPKDYLTVLLWALAVDQGKNFLQIQSDLTERTTIG